MSGNARLRRRVTAMEHRSSEVTGTTGLRQSWEEMYLELEDFVKEHGNCVPETHGTKLGRWVSTQRARYYRGELDDSQIRDLESIGFEWKLKDREGPIESWEEMFQNLCKYKEEHGHCKVPTLTTKLGRWVSTQRMRKRGAKSGAEALNDDQIARLDSIGFTWRQKTQSGFQWWDEMYTELEQYYQTHGNCLVKSSDGKLGNWVSIQRQRRRKNDLSDTQVEMLNELDFEWDLGIVSRTWEENFQMLQEFHSSNGHCKVTKSKDYFLSGWVSHQRMNRRKPRPGWKPLTEDQIAKLDSLGFVWEAGDYDAIWDEMYLELSDFYSENGHTRVPCLSGKLGRWVKCQRQCKDKKCGSNRKLTKEQIERLDAIEFVWRADENIETWEEMYEKLKAYKEANGNCLVPQSQGKLGGWVDIQRQRRKKQVGRQKKLTPEQVRLLDAIGFAWSKEERLQELWEEKFQELKAFVEEHGHCKVTRPRVKNAENKSLAGLSRWVERMRGIHKGTLASKTKLTEDQIKRLDALGCFRERKRRRTG